MAGRQQGADHALRRMGSVAWRRVTWRSESPNAAGWRRGLARAHQPTCRRVCRSELQRCGVAAKCAIFAQYETSSKCLTHVAAGTFLVHLAVARLRGSKFCMVIATPRSTNSSALAPSRSDGYLVSCESEIRWHSNAAALGCAVPASPKPRVTIHGHPCDACVAPPPAAFSVLTEFLTQDTSYSTATGIPAN